jgi:hypothetical protein
MKIHQKKAAFMPKNGLLIIQKGKKQGGCVLLKYQFMGKQY